jgi:hypothetical protein
MTSLAEAFGAIQRALGGILCPDPGGSRLILRGGEIRLRRARGGVTVEHYSEGKLRAHIPTDANFRAVVAAARGLVGGR